jgi:hypothetical protein
MLRTNAQYLSIFSSLAVTHESTNHDRVDIEFISCVRNDTYAAFPLSASSMVFITAVCLLYHKSFFYSFRIPLAVSMISKSPLGSFSPHHFIQSISTLHWVLLLPYKLFHTWASCQLKCAVQAALLSVRFMSLELRYIRWPFTLSDDVNI